MKVAYIRVSSVEQNLDRQRALPAEKFFEEKASAADTDRPVLREMLDWIREGDEVVCLSTDRMCRNLADLIATVDAITGKGCGVTFVNDNLAFRPEADNDPRSTFMLHILGAVSQMERSILKERQAEGIAAARARGAYRGRMPALTRDQVATLRDKASAGVPVARLARDFGIGRTTAWAALSDGYVARDEVAS